MKKLSGSKAIKAKCLDCAGSTKEVTLCHIFDCPLWQWRCGCHINSTVYKNRMKASFKNHKDEHYTLFIEFGIVNKHFLTGNFKYADNFEAPKKDKQE